jgi:hypothetical protein
VVFLLFSACIDEADMKPVVPYSLIHGNSSKVWILDEIVEKDGNIKSNQIHQNKLTYTFFDTNYFALQKMIHFGTPVGQKGTFTCYMENGEVILRLDFKKKSKELYTILLLENHTFEFKSLTSENIYRLTAYSLPL